jgi:hydroxymethylpyrimidine/phosphomethylpyrimidine kinase
MFQQHKNASALNANTRIVVKNKMKKPPVALTIAGSDPCAGAGIQADLKTFSAFGVYGVCALTAITSQNTTGVQEVYRLPAAVVRQQLDSVLSDIGIAAMKTGMLWDGPVIKEVARSIKKFDLRRIVVDPVICAGDGSPLLQEDALSILRQELLPLADLITPNIPEAQVLCGFEISSPEDMQRAAKAIQQLNRSWVLIKGGHLPGEEVIDLLYDGKNFSGYAHPHISGKHWHGTGCVLSAAVTAGLAQQKALTDAVGGAINYIKHSMLHSVSLGQGSLLLAHHTKERS